METEKYRSRIKTWAIFFLTVYTSIADTLTRIGGKRFRNAVGKRIRYAGVYGSKKYRSGFILGRYFFVPMRRQNSESRNTDIAK